MASWLSSINRLLPFATPGTPLLQDLLHLGIICVLLYLAPQIQERLQGLHGRPSQENEAEAAHEFDESAPQHAIIEDNAGAPNIRIEDDNIIPNIHDEGNGIHRRGPEVPQDLNENRPEAGPANDGPAVNLPLQRNVGAKKAKSLARRDQRRAYHEFMRNQGDEQRARDAEGASEREAAQAAERERRRAAEAKLEAKKAKEREERREVERREREEETARRERVVTVVRREMEAKRTCNLFEVARDVGGDVDDVWVQKILTASGMLGRKSDGSLTMITGTGWVVKVGEDDMTRLYKKAAQVAAADVEGKISYERLGELLESILEQG